MYIAVFAKIFNERSAAVVVRLLEILDRAGVAVCLYAPLRTFMQAQGRATDAPTFTAHHDLPPAVDYFISVGGDGSFLESVQIVRDSGIPIAGVNIGRLGFLASIAETDLAPAVDKLLGGALPIEERTLLAMEMNGGAADTFPCALNDMVVQKKGGGLITVHVWCDEVFLNSYWADGLIVATPTGSSAYSLSVGGPIVAPHAGAFIISPIAPHHLTVRPIVIPDSATLRLKAESRSGDFSLSLDSRNFDGVSGTDISLRKAPFTLRTVAGDSFFATLRGKLMWGEDRRN